MRIEIEDTEWETEALSSRSEVALEQIKVLGEKLDETESVIDVNKMRELAAKVLIFGVSVV